MEENEELSKGDDEGAVDTLLALLVGFASKSYGNEVPITLTIGGAVITGRIVHPARYLDEFGKQMAMGFHWDPASDEAQNMATIGQRSLDGVEQTAVDRYAGRFIHLKDAHFFVNGDLHPNGSSFWWRGLLSSVDGFTLGTLERKA